MGVEDTRLLRAMEERKKPAEELETVGLAVVLHSTMERTSSYNLTNEGQENCTHEIVRV